MSDRMLTPAGLRHPGTKLRRVLPPRGATFTPQPEPIQPAAYDQGGRVLAELSATSVWSLLWLFNGGCTAVAVAAFAQWLAGKITHGQPPFWVSYWLMIPVGVVVHIIVSSIEQHLWRSGEALAETYRERIEALFQSVRTAEAVGIGAFDAGTTSFTVRLLAWFFGAPNTLATTVWSAIIGTFVALVAEPMVRYHGARLRALVRERRLA